MNHLTPEERAAFVGREATPEKQREMRCHIEQCSQCAAEVEAWRRTVSRLKRWKVPARRAGSTVFRPVLRWAAAAAVALALGFGLGRISVTPVNTRALQADLAESLGQALRAELQRDLSRQLTNEVALQLSALRGDIAAPFQQQAGRELAQFAVNLSESSKESARLVDEMFRSVQEGREADRQAVLALIQEVRRQQSADYLSLRKDLETVASLADDEIRRARLGIIQFVTNYDSSRKSQQH